MTTSAKSVADLKEDCEADISSSSADNASESPIDTPSLQQALKSKTVGMGEIITSASETDSSYYGVGDNLTLPASKTSAWNIHFLESSGIFFNDVYHSSPLDILNMIFDELKIFSPLTEEQEMHVHSLQKCMTFNTSINEVIHDKENIVQNDEGDIYLPDLETDIQNLCNTSLHKVEDFLIHVQVMISCQTAYLNCLRENGVPKDAFVKIFENFAEMCHILPMPGSFKRCYMNIQTTTVNSTSDVVLIPKRYRCRAFGPATACIVSIRGVKKLKHTRTFRPQHGKVRDMRSTSSTDSSDSESQDKQEPQIYEKVNPKCLCQHAGDLLVQRNIYGGILSRGRIWKYLPGMICVGTEVIFTLMKIKGAHWRELMGLSKHDTVKPECRATIFYSKPKDMLKKEDRDILVEAFMRLNNIE